MGGAPSFTKPPTFANGDNLIRRTADAVLGLDQIK